MTVPAARPARPARPALPATSAALTVLVALLAGGCSSGPHAPRPLVEPTFSFDRDGLHPLDAARLAAERAEKIAVAPPRAAEPALAWASPHPPRIFASTVR